MKSAAIYSKATRLNALYIHCIYVGTPAEIYIYGTQYWLIIVAIILMGFTVSTVYLPVFTTLKVSSSYEVIFYILLFFLFISHTLLSFLLIFLLFLLFFLSGRLNAPIFCLCVSLAVSFCLYLSLSPSLHEPKIQNFFYCFN